jgi:hypothetical protein
MPKTNYLNTKIAHADKARLIWQSLNPSERHGVRFGMFPFDVMKAALGEGFDGWLLGVALMDCAKGDGGMIV